MAAAPLGSYKDEMPVELSPLPPSQGMEALKDIVFGSVGDSNCSTSTAHS